ncbi:GNAT family N-acetyltransferase [Polluticoccus soli]|uniref:GNAT family N-acetyltransferase n=1 Tax=Polluticoccus soli TaxID=3034150 RepID=UPI0023E31382|nr:GNAT family N-acetyltransferase [Flavipsychrobacter sp. JY13-12]
MLELQLTPFPLLSTERLLLRAMSQSDVDALHALRNNDDAMRYIKKERQTKDEVAKMIERVQNDHHTNEAISWVITRHDEPTLMGTIGLWRIDRPHHRAEIGYMLHPDYWRKGYLTEAIQAVMQYGFEHMKLHSVEGQVDPRNTASRGLLEKKGFVQEAHFKENYHFRGDFYDTVVYSKLKGS